MMKKREKSLVKMYMQWYHLTKSNEMHLLSRVTEGSGPMKSGNRGKQRCQVQQV